MIMDGLTLQLKEVFFVKQGKSKLFPMGICMI